MGILEEELEKLKGYSLEPKDSKPRLTGWRQTKAKGRMLLYSRFGRYDLIIHQNNMIHIYDNEDDGAWAGSFLLPFAYQIVKEHHHGN